MKALIWVGCLGVFALVEVAAAMMGYELGVTPTILLSATCFLLARALSTRYDEAQKRKRKEQRRGAERK